MPQYHAKFGVTLCRIVLSSERHHYVAQAAYIASGRMEPLHHANGELVSIWGSSEADAVSMMSAYLAARFGERLRLERIEPAQVAARRATRAARAAQPQHASL